MLPSLLLQSVTGTRIRPGISGCMLVMWNAFFRQFCLQAKNEQEDCAYYKEDSDRGSHWHPPPVEWQVTMLSVVLEPIMVCDRAHACRRLPGLENSECGPSGPPFLSC